jgi:hypothetical protein
LNVFVDNMSAKRDFTLDVIQGMVARLATEINNEMGSRREGNGHEVRVEDEGA